MNYISNGPIKIFTCNANRQLAADIAKELGCELGLADVKRFPDGEVNIMINETVRGADAYIIQPTSPPVNEHLMELLIMIDAFKRASAGRITAVIPYFGYARQDKKNRARDPISAKLVANLITVAGANRVLTMDLHCAQVQGFFDIPVDHLVGAPILAKYYAEKISDLSNVVAVSPDVGSLNRTRLFASKLDVPIAIIDKRRPKDAVSEVMNIIGEVEGKETILIDEQIQTGGSIVNAAAALKKQGVKKIYACCTHAVLADQCVDLIDESDICELVALNTIELPKSKRISKIKTLDVSALFANAIRRTHEELPVSVLFD